MRVQLANVRKRCQMPQHTTDQADRNGTYFKLLAGGQYWDRFSTAWRSWFAAGASPPRPHRFTLWKSQQTIDTRTPKVCSTAASLSRAGTIRSNWRRQRLRVLAGTRRPNIHRAPSSPAANRRHSPASRSRRRCSLIRSPGHDGEKFALVCSVLLLRPMVHRQLPSDAPIRSAQDDIEPRDRSLPDLRAR